MKVAIVALVLCIISIKMNLSSPKYYLVETKEKRASNDFRSSWKMDNSWMDEPIDEFWYKKKGVIHLDNSMDELIDELWFLRPGVVFTQTNPGTIKGDDYVKPESIKEFREKYCITFDGGYFSPTTNIGPALKHVESWQECAVQCSKHLKCKFWSFGRYPGRPGAFCYLKTGSVSWVRDKNWHSAIKACGDKEEKRQRLIDELTSWEPKTKANKEKRQKWLDRLNSLGHKEINFLEDEAERQDLK